MAEHQVKMWDRTTKIVAADPAGYPVAAIYVEQRPGEVYLEIEYNELLGLSLTDKLLWLRYKPDGQRAFEAQRVRFRAKEPV